MAITYSQRSKSGEDAKAKLGQQRLLMDIQELITKPYPNITLHTHEDDISRACLVLYPEYYTPLHLSISFPRTYPISPPHVLMDSEVRHPNVHGSFICATILQGREEYTPAYTLKGIAIQLLSFFDSESLEQEHSDKKKNLATYQEESAMLKDTFNCRTCQFGMQTKSRQPKRAPVKFDARVEHNPDDWPLLQHFPASSTDLTTERPIENFADSVTNSSASSHEKGHIGAEIDRLPNEILLLIIESLEDFEHLTNLARAWPRISGLVRDFNVIRQRELQCFCLKEGYQSAKLGVGVSVHRGQISSEFDLVSHQAYESMEIRHSVQKIRFEYWLPLPISHRHWERVRGDAHHALSQIRPLLKTPGKSDAKVLFTFMNDIVVRLNLVTERMDSEDSHKSTLRHASEKAIESYFHLFHLLVCLATENPDIVQQANKLLWDFQDGKQSKTDCSNLGHLLIALLISDVQVTDALIKTIITEAITRNVVWLFDRKGADMPELSYIERDAVSAYRLDKTFQGSRTSYRLLMFSELFRRTARPSHEKTLSQVRDELFDRHGAPPRDAAGYLAAEVRRLHTIDNFPAFLREMGLQNIPTPANFTSVLKFTVHASMARGYSKWALSQTKAMQLRAQNDPFVLLTPEERSGIRVDYRSSRRPIYNFFPGSSGDGQSTRGK
jgi:ubiquitin-protein ligase